MIEARGLTKIYRTSKVETTALDGVDLTVSDGELVAVMGPSGCGKTTLLNMLGLLDEPTEGELRLFGSDTATLSERERTKLRKGSIGFVFQEYNLLDDLTVFENVELPLVYMRVPRDDRKQRTREALDRIHISHRSDHYPRELSGGQQQRAAIARALVTRPRLVLADEPTGNLDSKNSRHVLNLLHELQQGGIAVLYVTHSEEQAELAKRVIHLFDGRIVSVEEGDAENVLEMDLAEPESGPMATVS